MYSHRSFFSFVIFCVLSGFAVEAHAQATRTWVSGTGDDANPCSRTAPCKTWQGAISKTAAGGEIDAIDPGGYGVLTIAKSLTVDGGGVTASALNAGTNGITVSAGAGDTVNLRNLQIQGAGSGTNGINYVSGGNLNILNCLIVGQNGDGIHFNMATASLLFVKNSVIKDCTGDGINISTSGGLAKALLDDVSIAECTNGIHARNNARLSAIRCSISGNSAAGVFAEGTGATAVANVSKSEVSNNGGAGVQAGGGASTQPSIVRISDCELHANSGIGAQVLANGEIDTWQNNRIFSNNGDGCPGCTAKGSN